MFSYFLINKSDFFFQMLKSIVLKNFVHFKEKTVIVLNSSQREQTEEKTKGSSVNSTPTESTALNNPEIAHTVEELTNTGAHTTPIHRNALDVSQRAYTEKRSTNTSADTTSIDSNALNYSQKGQTEEQSTSTGANTTTMDGHALNDSQKTHTGEPLTDIVANATPKDENGLNIFVGANFCGKSTILELIRRCMTDDINVSVTTSYDETMVAYAFCQFDLPPHGEIISGIIKDPQMNKKMYKVFIYQNCTLIRSKVTDSDTIQTQTFSFFEEQKSKEVIESILNKNDDRTNDDRVNEILRKIKQNIKENEGSSSNKPDWNCLEQKFIATFPLRGIGSVQWTKSKRIGKEHKAKNYTEASERAEIISTLLSDKTYKEDIIEKDDTKFFNFLTYPEVFKFEIVGEKIMVRHNGLEFDLLKTSEGIIEARVVSLLLAHKDIQTLCLEDPDRGMHPQMIERLKTVLYKSAHCKTIIVVTHSPYFIDTITIDKTHVFIRNRLHEPYVCSVLNVGDNSNLSKVADIETLRILLFATKVLLVEGPTDRDVIQAILTHVKFTELEKSISEESKEIYLTENVSTHQIIPIGGCENVERVQAFCDYIDLTCLCLLDRDKPVGGKNAKKVKLWGKQNDIEDIEKLEKKNCPEESAEFRTKKHKCFETYIEALKSKRKTKSAETESEINEIISFRQKEKRDEDLKNYIESLEKHMSIENDSDLRNEPLQKYLTAFESKKGNSATELEKENLRKITNFWQKRKKEDSFQEYIGNLKTKYGNKTPKEFWENDKEKFEEYLKKLETNRKTFVWRSGELEDAILSSKNYLEIDKVLNLTCKKTKDSHLDSEKNCGEEHKNIALISLRDKLKERLDDYTRKQFSKCLMDVGEIQNLLKFIREETKSE